MLKDFIYQQRLVLKIFQRQYIAILPKFIIYGVRSKSYYISHVMKKPQQHQKLVKCDNRGINTSVLQLPHLRKNETKKRKISDLIIGIQKLTVANPAILLRRRFVGMMATSSAIFLLVWKSRVIREQYLSIITREDFFTVFVLTRP